MDAMFDMDTRILRNMDDMFDMDTIMLMIYETRRDKITARAGVENISEEMRDASLVTT